MPHTHTHTHTQITHHLKPTQENLTNIPLDCRGDVEVLHVSEVVPLKSLRVESCLNDIHTPSPTTTRSPTSDLFREWTANVACVEGVYTKVPNYWCDGGAVLVHSKYAQRAFELHSRYTGSTLNIMYSTYMYMYTLLYTVNAI